VSDTLDLWGSGKVHADAHDSESEAAAPDRSALRRRVLEVLRNAGPKGSTDEETSVRAHIARSHSAATRRLELMERGYPIRDSGNRRATSSGRSAVVWVWDYEAGQ